MHTKGTKNYFDAKELTVIELRCTTKKNRPPISVLRSFARPQADTTLEIGRVRFIDMLVNQALLNNSS